MFYEARFLPAVRRVEIVASSAVQYVKDKADVVGLGVVTALASASSYAALDPSIDTAFAAVEADAKSLSGIVVPYVVSILGLMIVIKLVKRFGNKL